MLCDPGALQRRLSTGVLTVPGKSQAAHDVICAILRSRLKQD